MTGLDPNLAQREAADPAVSAWVAASAGTGKTKVLADRVLNLLLAGTPPERLLCLTFTRAAAAEMATRIAETLGDWTRIDAPDLEKALADLLGRPPGDDERTRARRLFAKVLDSADGPRIETIHAFCQSVLRRFPLEAGLSPQFAVMDDRTAAELLAEARETVLAAARDGADPDLAAALGEVTLRVHETRFDDLMGALAAERGRLRRLFGRHGGDPGRAAAELRTRLGVAADDTPDRVLAAACDDAALDPMGLRLAVQVLAEGKDSDARLSGIIGSWLAGDREARTAGFDAYAAGFLAGESGIPLKKIRRRLITKALATANPGVAEILETEADRLLATLDRRRAAGVAAANAALLRLVGALLDAYAARKAARGLLDYEDLVASTRSS